MHEFSVALEVCRMAEDRLGPEAAPRLRKVGMLVGYQSGLEPANLSFCLDALLAQPPFGAACCALASCDGDELRVDYFEVEDESGVEGQGSEVTSLAS